MPQSYPRKATPAKLPPQSYPRKATPAKLTLPVNKPSGISVQPNVGKFCATQLPNTFVPLCNIYILPLAPKTKESVFSKRAGPFFVAIAAFFKIYQIIKLIFFEIWQILQRNDLQNVC